MIDLKNRVVVITGAANGLGKALATEFHRLGSHLALIDIDMKGLEQVKKDFYAYDQRISLHQADVTIEQNIILTRNDILKAHKQMDILVNNAGISMSRYFEHTELTDFKRIFDVNFWGTIYCTKHFMSDLKAQNNSCLVNIISDFAFMGFPGKTTYGASKSAVWGFTNSLKTELHGTNVHICFVVPPPLNTGLVRNGKHISNKKRENEVRFLEKNGQSLDKTAKKIVSQIIRGRYRIIIGTMTVWIDFIARFFPTLLHHLIGKYKGRFDFI